MSNKRHYRDHPDRRASLGSPEPSAAQKRPTHGRAATWPQSAGNMENEVQLTDGEKTEGSIRLAGVSRHRIYSCKSLF